MSSEDLHSLIKLKSLSLLPAGGYYNDEDRIIEITDCLAALEKFNNEKNDYEEFNRVLLCLYSLSEILVASKRRSKNVRKTISNIVHKFEEFIYRIFSSYHIPILIKARIAIRIHSEFGKI